MIKIISKETALEYTKVGLDHATICELAGRPLTRKESKNWKANFIAYILSDYMEMADNFDEIVTSFEIVINFRKSMKEHINESTNTRLYK